MNGRAGARTPPVFLVDVVPDDGEAVLTGHEARHAAGALRIRTGEQIVLTDGSGDAAVCGVASVRTGRDAELRVTLRHRWHEAPPDLRVTVAQALVKGDRGEQAVELATEAGADAILPWQAARSVARWDDATRRAKGHARWSATTRAAAKQARRVRLPEVADPVTTAELAAAVGRVSVALVLDAEAATPLHHVALPHSGELLVIIGPEGGIAEDELHTLESAGAQRVCLGPSVLRAATAAAVALGALGATTSRWA